MVKPLSFKGDKKTKKRKRVAAEDGGASGEASTTGREVVRADATAEAVNIDDDDDSWVSADAVTDLTGPIVIVLPTEPPAALACDANGNVFPLAFENIVDANPASAEPHDVRQVWVMNRVSGTEHFRFKGHHGRYLACAKDGSLSATSEAVSPLESFSVFPTANTPGTFQIQTLHDTFLGITASDKPSGKEDVHGTADAISFGTTLRIRMQARFKPRVKTAKEDKARDKVSRRDLEDAAGRKLDDDEVKRLKRARREGDYHEQLLMIKVKGKHDKYS
ncbi:FRG1-like family protein [Plectosphaerella plurivora]|uniref:FRG1-like family protein n=1 Tax=Plectosphaerella plurivora TaxID=936078 RepID=A0A9P8V7Y3_9PEZI|nr:FRG1-like family protein [Plectosphaerella plurivora]